MEGAQSTAIDKITDASVRADNNSQLTNIRLIGFDKPLLTAVAIVLAIVAFIFSYEAWHEAQNDEYWLQRAEGFIEQLASQGVKVPPDLLPNHPKPKGD